MLFAVFCSFMVCFTVSAADDRARPRIAGIISTKSTYWQEMLRGIEEGCEEQGISFFSLDISLQDRDAMTWSAEDAWNLALLSDVDAIIADGNVPDSGVVEKVRERGIFVVLVDSDAGEKMRDAYVGTDNMQAGRLAVQVLEELYGINHNPVMVQSNADIAAISQRFDGICEGLKQKCPEVKIKYPDIPWYFERMFHSGLEELILENPDLQAIFGLTESETRLYAQILMRLQMKDQIPLIAFDISEEILEFLKDGVVDAVIVQKSYEIGYRSAQIAKMLIDGGTLEQDIIYIECSVITQEKTTP